MDPLKTDQYKLREFLTWKNWNYKGGITKQTARNYLYALRDWLFSFGISISVDATSNPLLGAFLNGLDRLKPPSGGSAPVDFDVIKLFYAELDDKIYDNCVWRAIYAFGHNAIKRPSEYTTDKPLVGALQWNGISWKLPEPVDVHFCTFNYFKSKTNQLGRAEWAVLICMCPNPCALHELYRILCVREDLDPSLPIFIFKNGKILDYNKLRNKTSYLIKKLKLVNLDITPHGMRKGGAQDFIARGVPPALIMSQASWKSLSTLQLYIKNMSKKKSVDWFVRWWSTQQKY